jgi:DNA repair protein RadA/Sms
MDKRRTIFVCSECGRESPKWMGRCPDCEAWNTFSETVAAVKTTPSRAYASNSQPEELSRVSTADADRCPLGMAEFDRVTGGGLVNGSLLLLSGEPGIGKSTLLLEIAANATGKLGRVIYVSGEESPRQIKLRAARLGIVGDNLFLLCETSLETILDYVMREKPALVVIDSIQTIQAADVESGAGGISQVRECTQRLQQYAKTNHVPVLISGHVTKDGAIAGPKLLEHIVDVVLHLEGEPFAAYRLLRSAKNRFGSTNEVGVYEMKAEGLVEVTNPSQAFLAARLPGAVGTTVIPSLEGSRPLLVEIQALTNTTSFGLPRRTVSGVDLNRLLLIAAVLSKRLRLKLGNQDIIVNATGGIRLSEPAADLGIALAIASSYRERPVDQGLVATGEIGLSGELRAVAQLERRVAEAARLGFKRCLVPAGVKMPPMKHIKVIPVSTLREALEIGLMDGKGKVNNE